MAQGEIGITNTGFNLLSQGVHWMEVHFTSNQNQTSTVLVPSLSRVGYRCGSCGAALITPDEFQ